MADFKIDEPTIVEKVSKALTPDREIHKMTADK